MAKPLRFDLADLRLYVAIIECGSLSKAAAQLPLALSAASARLKALEQRLSLQLVERSAQGVSPTHAGKLFYDHALRMLQVAQDAQAGMDTLSGNGRTSLTLFSNTTGLSSGLSQQLGEFLQTYPNVDLTLEQLSSRTVLKAVMSGEADLGVVDSHYLNDELLCLPYQRIELVVVVANTHSFASRTCCRYKEWLQQPVVGYLSDSSLQQFLQRMAVMERTPAQQRAAAPNYNSLAQLVAQEVGVAIMPRSAAERYAATLPLSVLALDEPWSQRELFVCIRHEADNSLPAWQLARFLTRP